MRIGPNFYKQLLQMPPKLTQEPIAGMPSILDENEGTLLLTGPCEEQTQDEVRVSNEMLPERFRRGRNRRCAHDANAPLLTLPAPEQPPLPAPFDPRALLAGLTEEQRAELAVALGSA